MDIGWYASKPRFPGIAFQIYRNSLVWFNVVHWDPRRKKPQFAEYDPFMDDLSFYLFKMVISIAMLNHHVNLYKPPKGS